MGIIMNQKKCGMIGKEESLDPEDWKSFKELGHQMLDDVMGFLENIRKHKFEIMPEEVLEELRQTIPLKSEGYPQVYKDFLKNIRPYPVPTIHPNFWGFVAGSGSPYGVLAEMLAAGLNFSAPRFCSPVHVEKQVIEWLKTVMGFASQASGVLVSGGSKANFTGLAVARNKKALINIKKHGLQNDHPRMVLYVSEEGHKSLVRSVELLGLGNESLRLIPVNDRYQIDLSALEKAIEEDKKAGCYPFCVIGNAGTTNTGAFDDLSAIADLCQRENLWFHVDGAFGAWAKLSSTHNHLVRGMERADSLAFDLHKWMYMPYEVGCVLVADREAHCDTFIYEAEYLESVESERHDPVNYSLQLSRNFKALKVWMLIKADGMDKYARLIQQNIDQASYLVKLVEERSQLELIAAVSLNIVCFRYKCKDLDEANLKKINKQILMELWLGKNMFPSDTTLKGVYGIRVSITNHRTKSKDLALFIDEVIETGNRLCGKSTE